MMPKEYERHFIYFDRSVLAQYRVSPNIYELREDDMGGILETRLYNDLDNESSEDQYVKVRFGFRRLKNNCVCIAGLLYDILELPEKDQLIWRGNMLNNPGFAQEDPAFERWIHRYIEGSWDIEDGPRIQIERHVKSIRALTHLTLGRPLFRFEENILINYPISQNEDAYDKAHLELYRLIIDGLDKDALGLLACKLKIPLSDSKKTLNSLKELLPYDLIPIIHKPLKKCSKERSDIHGVPSEMGTIPVFDRFHRDLIEIAASLEELNKWLEKTLSADSVACLEREEWMKGLSPKFIGPPKPEFKLNELRKAEDKTIESVEFGEEGEMKGVHGHEGMIFHFTDGTSMSILVGSNVGNLAHKSNEIKEEEFKTDLMVFWAPSIQKKIE